MQTCIFSHPHMHAPYLFPGFQDVRSNCGLLLVLAIHRHTSSSVVGPDRPNEASDDRSTCEWEQAAELRASVPSWGQLRAVRLTGCKGVQCLWCSAGHDPSVHPGLLPGCLHCTALPCLVANVAHCCAPPKPKHRLSSSARLHRPQCAAEDPTRAHELCSVVHAQLKSSNKTAKT